MPGSRSSTVSASDSLPSPTSCSTTVATIDFVLLPARKRSVGRSGRPLPTVGDAGGVELEAVAVVDEAITPGEPAATSWSSFWSSVNPVVGTAVVAAAGFGAGWSSRRRRRGRPRARAARQRG